MVGWKIEKRFCVYLYLGLSKRGRALSLLTPHWLVAATCPTHRHTLGHGCVRPCSRSPLFTLTRGINSWGMWCVYTQRGSSWTSIEVCLAVRPPNVAIVSVCCNVTGFTNAGTCSCCTGPSVPVKPGTSPGKLLSPGKHASKQLRRVKGAKNGDVLVKSHPISANET